MDDFHGVLPADELPDEYAALADAIGKAFEDGETRVISIRGEGQDFAAGNDLADMPLFGMNRYLVLADSDPEAIAIARRAYKCWRDAFYFLWDKRGGKPEHLSAVYPDTFDEVQSRTRGAYRPDEIYMGVAVISGLEKVVIA